MVTGRHILRWVLAPLLVLATPGGIAPACAAPPVPASADRALPFYSLERSATFEVRSAAGEAYQVMVAWPEGVPPAQGWPVLYVLDGEDNFAIVALTARRLAKAGQRSGIDPGVVVAIAAGPLPRRVRDYTPPVPSYDIPAGQPANGLAIGGAEAFLDLMSQRIMPEISGRWSVDPARATLVGHSFGGLLGLHALLTRPAMFGAVAAISPSLWYGDGLIDREMASPSPSAVPRRLLVAEGDERSTARAPANSAETIVHRLQRATPSVRAAFLNLPGQSHGSTFLAALVPTIRFAFGRDDQ